MIHREADEAFIEGRLSLFGSPEPAQQHASQMNRREVQGILIEGRLDEAQGPLQFTPGGGNPGQKEEAPGLGGLVPGGFVEPLEGFIVSPLVPQGQSKVEEGLALGGVGIAPLKPPAGGAEVRFGLGEFGPLQTSQPHGVVHPAVAGITFESLEIVGLRGEGGVSILLDVPPPEKELFISRRGFRLRRGSGLLGPRGLTRGIEGIADKQSSLPVVNPVDPAIIFAAA